MSLSAPIYVLKRKAKLLSREANIPLNQALGRIAKNEGFQSWSLLIQQNSGKNKHQNNDANSSQTKSFPYSESERAKLIRLANSKFEKILDRIEPENPKETRKLWDAESYVDDFLSENDLPSAERDYAEHILIDAQLVHYAISLAVHADKQAKGE